MKTYLHEKYQNLSIVAKENKTAYSTSNPFPNIHFENFFNPIFLDAVVDEFPDLSSKKSNEFNDKKHKKLTGIGERFFGPNTKLLMHYLNSEPFLKFIQELTEIKEPLIGDPYFIGGGQHEIKKMVY
ncbi:MAG: hypothetical protein ACJA01_002518 [Saprospiraceae bacterium]|jgi:hypothetical protein